MIYIINVCAVRARHDAEHVNTHARNACTTIAWRAALADQDVVVACVCAFCHWTTPRHTKHTHAHDTQIYMRVFSKCARVVVVVGSGSVLCVACTGQSTRTL